MIYLIFKLKLFLLNYLHLLYIYFIFPALDIITLSSTLQNFYIQAWKNWQT